MNIPQRKSFRLALINKSATHILPSTFCRCALTPCLPSSANALCMYQLWCKPRYGIRRKFISCQYTVTKLTKFEKCNHILKKVGHYMKTMSIVSTLYMLGRVLAWSNVCILWETLRCYDDYFSFINSGHVEVWTGKKNTLWRR